jgi:hypothetical protein
MPTWAAIVLAVVAPGGVIVTLLERVRRENNRDHARNSELLTKIDGKVDKIDSRLDSHIDWHAHND